MVVTTQLEDVFLLKTNEYKDTRGSFKEAFNLKIFEEYVGKKINFCQDNISISKRGVIRGLHYQLDPFSQSKLVSVISGKVLDIVVDLRKGSPSFGKHLSQELSVENGFQLFIPRGFAHGYITLSESSIFHYKVDEYYHPESDSGIVANDNTLGINWQIPESEWIQSEKDKNYPSFGDVTLFNYKTDLYG
jgi:dTDP-4-dehydrorhamnose 3,5-epimerase